MNNYKLVSDHGLQVEYLSFGKGKKTMLCFHGFGRNAEDFLPFDKWIGDEYTIHSINLFFHGNSTFPDSRLEQKPLSQEELNLFLELIRKKEKFDRFSISAYSLGGKIALGLTEIFCSQINELYLIAPDGIKANPWYYFASQTLIGQKLNKVSIQHPSIFKTVLKISEKLNFVSERQGRFALSQMENEFQRNQVYRIWMAYRKIKPNLNYLAILINKYDIKTTIYVGKHERVVPIKPIQKFVFKLKSNGTFVTLNTGHSIDFNRIGKLILSNTVDT